MKVEIHQSTHIIAKLAIAQAKRDVFGWLSAKAISVSQSMKMNPPTFSGVRVEEDPQVILEKI